MMRWILAILFAVLGIALLVLGLATPAYLRARDSRVVAQAGINSRSPVDEGLVLVKMDKVGPARMFLAVAERHGLEGTELLQQAIRSVEQATPAIASFGTPDPYLEQTLGAHVAPSQGKSRPVMEMFVSRQAREALTELLSVSRRRGVQELLQTRALTNTVHFPPVSSASGQPLETAILLTALLFQADHFSSTLQNEIEGLARTANQGGGSGGLELVFLDLVSLGKRFDWGQLTHLIRRVDQVSLLRTFAAMSRQLDHDVPILFAAVHWSPFPDRLAAYLVRFGLPAVNDLAFALGHGQGAMTELLHRQKPVHYRTERHGWLGREPISSYLAPLVHVAERSPRVGLALKYDLLLVGGMLLVLGLAGVRRPDDLDEPDPLLTTPRAVVALLLFFVVLVLTEPYFIQKSQKLESPLSWQFPMAPESIRATIETKLQPMMDHFTLIALLGFLLIQAVIYSICLVKLREIRRQPVSSRLKLRLLDNEENMFDSGLYFGLGGTVAALVLLAMGIIQASLMAAYASTLFGIIFVALLKICHLRPFRRRLIIESESSAA